MKGSFEGLVEKPFERPFESSFEGLLESFSEGLLKAFERPEDPETELAYPKGERKNLSCFVKVGFKIRIALWIAREPKRRQKEGQEDQGEVKELRESP